MKKGKILILLILAMFMFNTKVFATTATLAVSKSEVSVGDTFKVTVNMEGAAAWEIHVDPSGTGTAKNTTNNDEECKINEANVTENARDTTKTFEVTCIATKEGNISFTLSGNITSDKDDDTALNISGIANVLVKEKSQPASSSNNNPSQENGTSSQQTVVINPPTGLSQFIIVLLVGLLAGSVVLITRYFNKK